MSTFAGSHIESTGRAVEAEYIRGIRREYYKIYGSPEHAMFRQEEIGEAFEAVERNQPWKDPSDPTPEFANDLHATVAENLELEDYSDLGFYTAVGTHLDYYFGTDAFFKLKIGDGQEIYVSLDLTSNEHKYDAKADVIIHVPDYLIGRKDNHDEYMSIVKTAARDITAKFKIKLNQIVH